MKIPSLLALASSSLFLASSAQAILIDFDAADGYDPGSISGEPSSGTQWQGNGDWLAIVNESGNQLAQSPAADPANFSNNRFAPTAADLGGTNAAAGLYNFSFDLRSDSTPTEGTFNTASIVRVAGIDGGATAVRLNIFSNGRIQYLNGGTSENVLDSGGGNFNLDTTPGAFVTISGTIDFSTSQYSLVVNGVTQGSTIGFNQTGHTDFGTFQIQAGNTDAANYRQTSYDNINLAAVPEPGTTASLIVAGIALLAFARRRKVRA